VVTTRVIESAPAVLFVTRRVWMRRALARTHRGPGHARVRFGASAVERAMSVEVAVIGAAHTGGAAPAAVHAAPATATDAVMTMARVLMQASIS
jgi:hypothetical protein